MMEVFVTIINNRLIVTYYRRELLFRYGTGSDARKRFSDYGVFSLEIEG